MSARKPRPEPAPEETRTLVCPCGAEIEAEARDVFYTPNGDVVGTCPACGAVNRWRTKEVQTMRKPANQPSDRPIPMVSPKDMREKLEEWLDNFVYALKEANAAPPAAEVKAVMDELLVIVRAKPPKVGLIAMGSVLRMGLKAMEQEMESKAVPWQPGSGMVN